MEEELKCPVCHNLFVDPVILPCTHNLCSSCADTLQSKNAGVCDASPDYFGRVVTEFDKVSLLSEAVFSDTDSGYSAGSLRSNSSDQGGTGTASVSSSGSVATASSTGQVQPSSPVSCSPKSWPQSQGVHLPCLPESISCLTCPICQRTVFLDDRGVKGLTQNILMLNIIRKYENRAPGGAPVESGPTQPYLPNGTHTRPPSQVLQAEVHAPDAKHIVHRNTTISNREDLKCQMCEEENACVADVKCEQCVVRYCSKCRERFHPCRGPLSNHTLTALIQGQPRPNSLPRQRLNSEKSSGDANNNIEVDQGNKKRSQSLPRDGRSDSSLNSPTGIKLSPCSFHVVENMSMYCEDCKSPLCYQCLEDGRHRSHDVKAIGATYKAHKADLSQQMGALSNKARQAKDLVVHLRYVQEEIQKNSVDFESRAVAQCNALIEAINQKKQELVQRVAGEKEVRCKMVREQLQQCTMKLKQTTGLLEYCIEVMKDNDPAPFLQVSSGLIKRVAATEQQWTEHHLAPRAKSEFDFEMDATPLLQAIESFNIVQRRVPDKPIIKVAECISDNNTVTLSWMVHRTTQVDGFILEMDDGAKGKFRDVYVGKDTVCTVDGLHFNSVYRARVAAYNKTGRSQHSDIVQLQTSDVAVFHMDPHQSHKDVKFSNKYRTVNCTSIENRVSLGNIGFSRGIHYWEYSVDRYDSSNPDVVVGVAHAKTDKSVILGKDRHAWAMYIDKSRTWFYHDNEHTNRCEGGVDVGSRLGVLLDIDRQQVTYYVNQKQRGDPVSLLSKGGNSSSGRGKVYYPAVSLNRQVQVTLWPGQRPPVQIRRPLYHSHSFNGPAHAGSHKNKLVANHEILAANSNSVPRSSSKPSSSTAEFPQQKRSHSSGDLKGQRLYNSLPSQPVVCMDGPSPTSTIEKRSAHPGTKTTNEKPALAVKPALKKKPLELVNAIHQARGRQDKQGTFKVPPPPPLRRGSSNSSLSTVSSSTKSSESEVVTSAKQTQ